MQRSTKKKQTSAFHFPHKPQQCPAGAAAQIAQASEICLRALELMNKRTNQAQKGVGYTWQAVVRQLTASPALRGHLHSPDPALDHHMHSEKPTKKAASAAPLGYCQQQLPWESAAT